MHHYTQGKPTRQAHKGIPEGQFEEEQGQGGFFGPVSHLIKAKPSTRWVGIEGDLRPRMYDLVKLESSGSQRLLYNNDLTISSLWIKPEAPDQLKARRNADGDWLYFCHKGSGTVLTEYGLLNFTPGSYIVMQKCMTHVFVANDPCQFLLIENRTSHFDEPDRGMLGRNAFYDENALGKPDLEALNAEIKSKHLDIREVQIKHTDEMTKITYDSNLFDTIGWKGDLFPYTLHVDDMMPITSHRAHLPPSVHSTFIARGFVVCSFLPRPLEQDADALKVPFYHQNMDYDEVLFYHDGDFFSRDSLHAGMMSFHPAGFPHGPHPKAAAKSVTKTHTDEYAVMIDSRWPLKRDAFLEKIELLEYWKSWQTK
jgi:homogentisate 1,2-dioxygenase